MILDSGFYISANETQFNPSGNFTAFSDFPEDVLSVPTEELAVEDASPGQRPLHAMMMLMSVAENVPTWCLQNWSESQEEFVN